MKHSYTLPSFQKTFEIFFRMDFRRIRLKLSPTISSRKISKHDVDKLGSSTSRWNFSLFRQKNRLRWGWIFPRLVFFPSNRKHICERDLSRDKTSSSRTKPLATTPRMKEGSPSCQWKLPKSSKILICWPFSRRTLLPRRKTLPPKTSLQRTTLLPKNPMMMIHINCLWDITTNVQKWAYGLVSRESKRTYTACRPDPNGDSWFISPLFKHQNN